MLDFFTTQASSPPDLTMVGRLCLIILPLVLIIVTYRYFHQTYYVKCFIGLQGLQLAMLYLWYLWAKMPLSEILPLYHCRIAMFALLFLPQRHPFKQYFALLGVGGSIIAFVYPVFDPFPALHVTTFSFIFGHIALLVNCLVYLFQSYETTRLSVATISIYTLILNVGLVAVNYLTGGNYGFLRQTPLLNSEHVLLNYFVVSGLLILITCMMNLIFRTIKEKQVRTVFKTL